MDDLIQKLLRSPSSKRPRRASSARLQGSTNTSSRTSQVKAAVTGEEKVAFEALARRRGITLSNLIRDYLVHECTAEGITVQNATDDLEMEASQSVLPDPDPLI
jgi:hypothetical protein